MATKYNKWWALKMLNYEMDYYRNNGKEEDWNDFKNRYNDFVDSHPEINYLQKL